MIYIMRTEKGIYVYIYIYSFHMFGYLEINFINIDMLISSQ